MINASKYARLVQKNAETNPKSKDDFYGRLVSLLIRERYSQDDVEGINNNYLEYLEDPTKQEYADELHALQHYRKTCKKQAKEMLGMEEE